MYDLSNSENAAKALTGFVDIVYQSLYSSSTGYTAASKNFYWYAEDWTITSDTVDGVLEYVCQSNGTYAVKASNNISGVTNVIIPAQFNGRNVAKILPNGFKNLTHLQSITIPDTINEIGIGAFAGCTSLNIEWENTASVTWSFTKKNFIAYFYSGGSSLEECRITSITKEVSITPDNATSMFFTAKRYSTNEYYNSGPYRGYYWFEVKLCDVTIKRVEE
jgi:hypothetical protein